ncbi:hypothetical protein PISL3812_08642 [Talaromyces islandicus]|uniref:F-box domain-containing protein n=1 Tax=Talaromyces islandicus TaxID=28573 RepID=A0A0U1M8A6_TALIS|nr:hypothetical protein PISL3812_08642 [Talaromyces islandicus]
MNTPSFASVESRPPSPAPESVPFEPWTKEWTGDEPRKGTQGFSLIPREVAIIILEYLPDHVDKVCLALTTKPLWTFLNTRLDTDQFKLRGVLPSRVNYHQGLVKPWPFFDSPRWKLLERLEDRYWKCCAGCLFLQPKRDFSRTEIYREPDDRFCRAPGLIQLCPHVILTYRKCMGLQKALQSARDGSEGQEQQEEHVSQTAPTTAATMPNLTHQCVLESDETVVTCTILPKLSNRRNHLVFRNQYTVSDFSVENMQAWMSHFGDDALLPCPHRNISTHVLDMLHMHRSWAKGMTPKECDRRDQQVWCKFCWTYYIHFKTTESSPLGTRTVSFSTQRHIGKDFGLLDKRNDMGDVMKRAQGWVHRTDQSNVIFVGGGERSKGGWRFSRMKQWPRGSTSLPTMSWKQ